MRKKKAAKKKATKKKAARKKTSKRKAANKNKGVKARRPGTTKITIRGSRVRKGHARVAKNAASAFPDHVYWHSADKRYEVTFDAPPASDPNPWPFVENPDVGSATVVVPAKGDSRLFTIRANAVSSGYGYTVRPFPKKGRKPNPEVIPDP